MRMRLCTLVTLVFWGAWPAVAPAAWQVVFSEQGKAIEIDRDSITSEADTGIVTARGRIVLDKPIVDPKTSASYRIIEVVNRFDCSERTLATQKRSYFKDETELLRVEEVRSPFDMPVRSGSPDERLFREACRSKLAGASNASKVIDKANAAAAEMRKANEEIVARAIAQDQKKKTTANRAAAVKPAEAPPATPSTEAVAVLLGAEPRRVAKRNVPRNVAPARNAVHWSYEGAGAPENWGRLDADYALCNTGKRQSPIDIRDGIRVDLEPIQFSYKPTSFRVTDNGHTVQVSLLGGSINLLGTRYLLTQFHFHRPSEETINGKAYDMVAHLVHQSDQGKIAVVSVLLERGNENPIIQTVWNNLPLERDEDVAPPTQTLDLTQLLPENRAYYTYMGSLTTPPCSEGVLWLVLKQPVTISAEQLAIFARLYKNNARPIQSAGGRMIKESR